MINEFFGYLPNIIIFPIFQAVLIFNFLLKGRFSEAVMFQTIFVLTSCEWSLDGGAYQIIYNYRTVQVFSISISTIILIILLVNRFFKKSFSIFNIKKVGFLLILLFFSGTLIGIIGLVFSDYKTEYFFSNFQYYLILIMYYFLYAIEFQGDYLLSKFRIYNNIIIAVLFSKIAIVFIGNIINLQKSSYGGISVFTYDPVNIFSIFLLLAISKEMKIGKKCLLFFGCLLQVWNIIYFLSISGKGILFLFMLLPFYLYKKLVQNKKYYKKIIIIYLFLILVIGGFLSFTSLNNIVHSLPNEYLLLKTSYSKISGLFCLENYKNPYLLYSSAQNNLIELYNIIYELIYNPKYLLIGKGFGGYFEDKAFRNYLANDKGGYSTQEVISF